MFNLILTNDINQDMTDKKDQSAVKESLLKAQEEKIVLLQQQLAEDSAALKKIKSDPDILRKQKLGYSNRLRLMQYEAKWFLKPLFFSLRFFTIMIPRLALKLALFALRTAPFFMSVKGLFILFLLYGFITVNATDLIAFLQSWFNSLF